MAKRRITVNEFVEMVYRRHLGDKMSRISSAVGMDRKTVRKYVRLFEHEGILPVEGEFDFVEISRRVSRAVKKAKRRWKSPVQDTLRHSHDRIGALLEDPHMTLSQLHRLLGEQDGVDVGYMSLKRYVKRHFPSQSVVGTVRIETPAGEQCQIDFGYAGMMMDPVEERMRRTWAFVMVLSHSRHRFVRFVFRMDTPAWIDCHRRAFAFFGGVPRYVVLDNLKAGVLKADIYDPLLNRAYSECQRHYGFIADPARPRKPTDKGKVERSIRTLRQQVIAGRRFRDIQAANDFVLHWCTEEIGRRANGTTKQQPMVVFEQVEREALLPLPDEPFETPLWKECTVHPDHHIVFQKSYYSVPTRFLHKRVWVRCDSRAIRIFCGGELIKTHPPASRPGQRITDESDYPDRHLMYLMRTPSWCRSRASVVGPSAAEYMKHVLSDHPMRNLRKAQGVIRLGEKYGAERLEKACRRALYFQNFSFRTLKRILERGLDQESYAQGELFEQPDSSDRTLRFTRRDSYYNH